MNTLLSQKLRLLRKTNGLTINDIVNKLKKYNLDYSNKSVYKWEEGTSSPNINIIYTLANIYGCSISYLIDDKPLKQDNVTLSESRALKYYRDNYLFKNIADLTLRFITKYKL